MCSNCWIDYVMHLKITEWSKFHIVVTARIQVAENLNNPYWEVHPWPHDVIATLLRRYCDVDSTSHNVVCPVEITFFICLEHEIHLRLHTVGAIETLVKKFRIDENPPSGHERVPTWEHEGVLQFAWKVRVAPGWFNVGPAFETLAQH